MYQKQVYHPEVSGNQTQPPQTKLSADSTAKVKYSISHDTAFNVSASESCKKHSSPEKFLNLCHDIKQSRCSALCDGDLNLNQNCDLGANHRTPESILSCALKSGLQKQNAPRRSLPSLHISTEVKAVIWMGLLRLAVIFHSFYPPLLAAVCQN